MRTQYNPNIEETEFILTAEEMKDNDISIRADERVKILDEVNKLITTRLIANLGLKISDCVEDLLGDFEQLKDGKTFSEKFLKGERL